MSVRLRWWEREPYPPNGWTTYETGRAEFFEGGVRIASEGQSCEIPQVTDVDNSLLTGRIRYVVTRPEQLPVLDAFRND